MPLRAAPSAAPGAAAPGAAAPPSPPDRPAAACGRAGLVAQQADPDAAVRRRAARDLAEPEAVGPLCDGLAYETSPAVRQAILDSLAAIGSPAVVERVLPFLRSEDAALRNGVVVLLQQLPEPVGLHMAELLADPDPDVRILAIDILQTLPHPEVPAWLCRILERETDINVVGTAVDRLAELASPELAAPLAEVRRRFADEPYLCFAVDLALARLGIRPD